MEDLELNYFAYCTLLDENLMHKFCPGARRGQIGRTAGYRLVFVKHNASADTGGCNLEVELGHEVYGVLYQLSDDELDALSIGSGVDKGMYKIIDLIVSLGSGGETEAITYVMPHPGGVYYPPAEYMQTVLSGAKDVGLPAPYMRELEMTVRAATP